MAIETNRIRKRKYQVFISSTFQDLAEQRKAATEVIVDMMHMPVALERFPATAASDLEVIKKAIYNCQVYIAILGHRYGEIIAELDISYTEFEYKYAEKKGLCILPFLLTDEEIKQRRANLDHNKEADIEEDKNIDRLERFHNEIKKKRFYKPFTFKGDFRLPIMQALVEALEVLDVPGWILEPEQQEQRDIFEALSTDRFIPEIVINLLSFKKLVSRCLSESDSKNALAESFVKLYADQICKNKVNLFFESGSTIAYIAQAIAPILKNEIESKTDRNPTIELMANNVLAFLQFWLNHGIQCGIFPWSTPESTYGASYGSLDKIIIAPNPDYSQPPLSTRANAEIDKLINQQFSISNWNGLTLLLGAISGVQLGEKHTFTQPRDELSEIIINQLNKCFGLHVGSYKNKIFKRFMYKTNNPLMLFITSGKIDCPIDIGKCHFIMDTKYTWDQFIHEYPLAFGVGCLTKEWETYAHKFEKLGFQIITEQLFKKHTAFFARNDKFIEDFENKISFKI